ncbi:hypothetical protein, partial [Ensifer sp. 4252]|uniref:hypothetical protein n=1 Tax=Ensifer sp. 4252 TaxID=3373915 RepID=UPI003D2091CF
MIRLLPSTLAGQLGTLLLAGIIAAHLFSFAILSSESTDLLRAADRTILFHNAHLSMLLKRIRFPDLDAILWGVEGF